MISPDQHSNGILKTNAEEVGHLQDWKLMATNDFKQEWDDISRMVDVDH